MRKTCCATGVLVLFLAAGVVQSGDSTEPRAVIDKAIKALGGEANLSKFQALAMKGKGTYYGGGGDGFPYTAEWDMQLPDKARFAVESNINGQTFRMTIVFNGGKGWNKLNDDVKEMSKEEVAEQREELYSRQVVTLVPLKDKAFKLTSLGEVDVKGKPAVGVRVSHKDHRDVVLYFNKASGLPVKTEVLVKDIMTGGDQLLTQEAFLNDYKEFEGVKHATKVHLTRDGKRYVEAEFAEIRPAEKLDDSVFARP